MDAQTCVRFELKQMVGVAYYLPLKIQVCIFVMRAFFDTSTQFALFPTTVGELRSL